ncbi:MAG: polysaccharide deacetylase family protein [Pseudomonadota bacterium]
MSILQNPMSLIRRSHVLGFSSLIAIGLVLTTPAQAQEASAKRQIAITFDDAPRPSGALMSEEQRTTMLIDALASSDTKAMFFATTSNLERQGAEGSNRLEQYLEAGHSIANHSHSHASANRTEAEVFLADIQTAEATLAAYSGYERFYRFPYLHEGNTSAKRDAIRAGLNDMGMRAGYVTIDNYDWYLQALFSEAVKGNRPVELDAWRELYVEVLLGAIEFYDQIAVDTLGRSPAHVLLLHENELAALFVDDLIDALHASGWETITAQQAYEDSIAEVEPDTMLLGQGRVAAIASERGRPYTALIHPMESEAALRALLVSKGLVGLASGAYLGQTPPGVTPKVFAPGVISLADRYEYGSVFSPDGREMFFAVANEGRGEIFTTRNTRDGWETPTRILSDPQHSFADPFLSRDGTRLYFISTRASSDPENPNYDLYFVTRQGRQWSEPQALSDEINSEFNEYYVSFSDIGEMVFASNRSGSSDSDFDIFIQTPDSADIQILPGRANTKAYEADPFIAPDGSYIIFGSTRIKGQARDLYVTFRQADGTWSRGVSLGERINTEGIEFCPFVTRDGRFLFYTSNQEIFWVDAAIIDLARESLQSAGD